MRKICILLCFVLVLHTCFSNLAYGIFLGDMFDRSEGETILSDDDVVLHLSASYTSLDVDFDGDLDLIFCSLNNIGCILNDGGANWSDPFLVYALPPGPEGYSESLMMGDLCSGDFNRDGLDDFVCGGAQGFARLFLNCGINGSKVDFEVVELARLGQSAWGLDSGDFNRDGWLDFTVCWTTIPFDGEGYSCISLFMNNGTNDLGFERSDVFLFNYSYIRDLEVDDFDLDGDLDILFCYDEYVWHHDLPINMYGVAEVLWNEGNCVFEHRALVVKRGFPIVIGGLFYELYLNVLTSLNLHKIHFDATSADFDLDGDADIMISDHSGRVEYFENCGDGSFVSGKSFFRSIVCDVGRYSWGIDSADFDLDGDVDFVVAGAHPSKLKNPHYYVTTYFKENRIL